jgi:hypothetical protein
MASLADLLHTTSSLPHLNIPSAPCISKIRSQIQMGYCISKIRSQIQMGYCSPHSLVDCNNPPQTFHNLLLFTVINLASKRQLMATNACRRPLMFPTAYSPSYYAHREVRLPVSVAAA